MTFKEFLAELEVTKKTQNWEYDGPGIRCAEGQHCPITAVAYEKTGKNYDPGSWSPAAQEIGLSHTIAQRIVSAADGRKNEIREALKKATGLTK